MTNETGTLLRVFNQFRQIDLDLHIKTASLLTMIAHKEGLHPRELSDKLGLPTPTVSRMLSDMSKKKLIEIREAEDRRFKEIYLAPHGKLFFQSVRDLMQNGSR